MKASPRHIRRPAEPAAASSDDQVVIRLPDPQVLRLIARSVLLAAAILSFPWLRAAVLSGGGSAADEFPPEIAAADFPTEIVAGSNWVDDPFFLPMLISDLRRHGLIFGGGRAVFLGVPSSRLGFLRKNRIEPVPENRMTAVADRSVDFILAAEGFKDSAFSFVDRVLRVGGVTAVRLGSDPSQSSFHLPSNYRVAYIRRFGSTVVAMKKISHGNAGCSEGTQMGRRLFGVPERKSQGKSWDFGMIRVVFEKIFQAGGAGSGGRWMGRRLLWIGPEVEGGKVRESWGFGMMKVGSRGMGRIGGVEEEEVGVEGRGIGLVDGVFVEGKEPPMGVIGALLWEGEGSRDEVHEGVAVHRRIGERL